eukprot:sb/3471776/
MENVAPGVMRAVGKELRELSASPIEGVTVSMSETDFTDITAIITGPEQTPFEGGVFKIKLVLSKDFPASPPKGYFVTKVFHPNVADNGEICVNTLKRDWKSTLGIRHVLMTIRCLLIHPNPESALNEEAGRLLLEDYESFAARAKMMTEVHAKPISKSHPDDAIPTAKPAKKRGLRRL